MTDLEKIKKELNLSDNEVDRDKKNLLVKYTNIRYYYFMERYQHVNYFTYLCDKTKMARD